ncbi:MAG: phosphodiester glycosidase family protein [Pseudomonadota bacterium]
MKKLLIALMLCVACGAAMAQDARFTVVTIDTARQDLALFLNDDAGAPLHGFTRLAAWLQARNKRLVFAVNAGMYHPDFAPVGLHVQDGKQLAPLNLEDGTGNFFLKPNGVFMLSQNGPRVVESSEYPALGKGVRLATQSGPLLLRNGVIHPAFNPASSSRYIRNGVGVVGGKAIFVISNHPVTFHEFAVFFRDNLHCKDALYLDGSVSSLYSKELGRNDAAARLGPMLGVIE